MEENKNEETKDLQKENESVKEDIQVANEKVNDTKVDKKNHKNTIYIILIIVTCILIAALAFISIKRPNTYKLSTIYPDYFSEIEGEIKLPRNYLYTETGELYKNEDGKVTLIGQIYATEMTKEDYLSSIELLKSYYTLNEVNINGLEGYTLHNEQDGTVLDACIIFKDTTYLQILITDGDTNDVNTVFNSIKF